MSSRLTMILVLGALVALGPLTIDMYLPALPALTADLATTSSTAQLTLTGTLVGLALGQLVIGPLSDALGRRRPLLAGAALHVAASLAITVAPNVAVLGVLRVLQGVGAAAGAVIALAIIRDLYTGRAAATMFSRLMLVMGVAPVLAPTVGGELLRITSWRGLFVALAVYGVLVLAATAWALRESLAPEHRQPAGVGATLRTYGRLLHDRTFVGLVLVAGLTMAGLFGYVAGSSFVFQQQFGLDQQQFGLAFGAGAIFLIAATQLNAYLLRTFEPGTLLLAALVGGSVAGLVLVAAAATGVGGLAGVLVPMFGCAVRRRAGAAQRARAGAGQPRRRCGHGRRPARSGPVRRGCAGVARWSGSSATTRWPWAPWSPVGSCSRWSCWSASSDRGSCGTRSRPVASGPVAGPRSSRGSLLIFAKVASTSSHPSGPSRRRCGPWWAAAR